MDVSGITPGLNKAAEATLAPRAPRRRETAPVTAVSTGTEGSHRSGSGARTSFDSSAAIAERLAAGVPSRPNPSRHGEESESEASVELPIPSWARAAYASRARRGWFLPLPSALAGQSEGDD